MTLISSFLSAQLGIRPYQRQDYTMPYLVRLALAAGDRQTAATATELSQADTAADDSPTRMLAAILAKLQLHSRNEILRAIPDQPAQ